MKEKHTNLANEWRYLERILLGEEEKKLSKKKHETYIGVFLDLLMTK